MIYPVDNFIHCFEQPCVFVVIIYYRRPQQFIWMFVIWGSNVMCNISLHLFQDAITDLNADCECLSFEGLTGCVAHKGILQAATYVKNTLEEKGILEAAFDRAQVSMLYYGSSIWQSSGYYIILWKQHLTELRLVYWHWLRLPGLGNNNENLGLPERLSAGTQFRFRNLFHGRISGNRNFIC